MCRKTEKTAALLGILLLVLCLSACGQSGETGTEKQAGVIYMGDSQSSPEDIYNYESWGNLLKDAAKQAPGASAVILGGDLINEETDEAERQAFLQAADGLFKQIPFRSVSGNHTEDNDSWAKVFQLPQNGPAGYESLFYSFDAGYMHFIMMDSLSMGSLDEATQRTLTQWVKKDLASSKQPWKIAVMHHPMYPLNQTNKDQMRADTMQSVYLPVLEEGGVRLILCGHQHVYGRTVPMMGAKPAEEANGEKGIVQVMGVSGGKLYSAEKKDFMAVCESEEPVYTVLSGNKTDLELKTIGASGEVVDLFTLKK